jgi:hypothetical protein
MYAACGAVSRADHEKLQADLEAANEAQQEVKEELKQEAKSRKEAQKKVEQMEAEIAEVKEAKDKLDLESKKIAKDVEKKGTDFEKIKKQLDQAKADLEAEKEATVAAAALAKEAQDRADKAEQDLAQKAIEAEELQAKADEIKLESEKKLEEAVAQEVMKEEVLEKQIKAKEKPPPVWSSGLCSCCAKPGGLGLCLKTFCCPCITVGKINGYLKLDEGSKPPCPGGCPGGCCLGCCCEPCYMCKAAPQIALKNGKVEGKCGACMKATCCPCCYMTQVYRETLIITETGGAPLQETMGEGGTPAAAKDASATKWSTGLCKCCAKPGGCGLCFKAFCCPCMISGKLNKYLKENEVSACPGGCGGGCCLGCCCMPCFMRKAGPAVATLAGKEEGKCRACMCGMCCPCCYLSQVFRESLILTEG